VYRSEQLHVDRRAHTGWLLQEMRGVVRVRASLNAIMALLRMLTSTTSGCIAAAAQGIAGGGLCARMYGVVDAPWPMQAGDTIVRFDYGKIPTPGDHHKDQQCAGLHFR
jgi:hypothetical protein